MSGIGVRTRGLQVLDRKVFPVGEKIFREGDNGSRAYIVQSGNVDIVKEINDEDVVVGNVGPGGIFGEMALIDDEPRMASAVVSDTCVCIIITSAVFQKKMNRLDPFLGGVLRVLVENIRSIQESKQDALSLEAMFDSAEFEIDDGSDVSEPEAEVDGALEIA